MNYSPDRLRTLHGVEGAAQANGYVVIIDVFRAFSTACYAVSQGAKGILPVSKVTEAFELHQKHPHWILMGERKGIKVDGFDLGNSPNEIKEFGPFNGRMIIQATSNGTRGIAATRRADIVVTGSFVNAKAICCHIHDIKPRRVDLVCMGTSSGRALEDDLCAAYLVELINGKAPNFDVIRRRIYHHPTSNRFLTCTNEDHPIEDLSLCLSANIFDFVLCKESDDRGYQLLYPQKCPTGRPRHPAENGGLRAGID